MVAARSWIVKRDINRTQHPRPAEGSQRLSRDKDLALL
jgi:hypothetical protein